jgi:hypothetical protein
VGQAGVGAAGSGFGSGLGGWKGKLAARGVLVDPGGGGGKGGGEEGAGGGGGEAGSAGVTGGGSVGARTGGGVGAGDGLKEVFGVKLVVYGPLCVVSVKDDEFLTDPFCKVHRERERETHTRTHTRTHNHLHTHTTRQ